MQGTVTSKLIESHLVEGSTQGPEIALRIDQTLTQDATGTLVMLELEAMSLERVRTQVSVQYVDHNLLQTDSKNADDHRFLRSACRKYGLWYSRPGNGVSHPVHQERFGRPGATLLGSDSHTPAAGSIGMLAIGAGGIEVALAMAGEPFHLATPKVWGVRLVGQLPDWVSAKDIILEMLRRYGVRGGAGRVIEYHGPALEGLSAMDRHVIANMGTELGAVTTVFPSDRAVQRFLEQQGRANEWREIVAEADAEYDVEDEIDLSKLEPLIAMPSSPGNVRAVREVAGEPIGQAYVGSSANPGYRDFAVVAEMVKDKRIADGVSLDINPSSRQVLENLIRDGHTLSLIRAGARMHQTGCNGCIGMGQAPATDSVSLRTVPRNFPGRSGAKEDKVCLVSPETAAASALTGVIADPRTLDMDYPAVSDSTRPGAEAELLSPPASDGAEVPLQKGRNIVSLPDLEPLPDELALPVLLKVGDDISTDEILPAGSRVLPFRSNIPRISEFVFEPIDAAYAKRAAEEGRGHCIVAGANYGQGSSREHAALAPRFLGLRVVLAKSFSRIHRANLINFGVLPLEIEAEEQYDEIEPNDTVVLSGLHPQIREGETVQISLKEGNRSITTRHRLSARERDLLLAGGVINMVKARREGAVQQLQR